MLAVILGVGIALRLWMILSLPLWLDESLQWDIAFRPWWAFVNWTHDVHHAPLSFVLTRFSLELFGHGEWQLRLPSLVFAVINVLLAYWLGRLLVDTKTGLLLAAFFSVTPILVITDSYARCYPLLLFVVFLIYFEVNRMGDRPEQASYFRWLGLGLLLAAAFWVHPLALYVWIAVFFAFLINLRMRRTSLQRKDALAHLLKLVTALGLATLLSAVGILKMLAMTGTTRGPEPGRPGFGQAVLEFAGTSTYPLLFLAAVVGLLILLGQRRSFALQMFVLAASGLAIVYAGQRNHHVVAHYFYPLAIPIYLGVAALVGRIIDGSRRWKSAQVAVIVIVVCLLGWRANQSYCRVRAFVDSSGGGWEGSRLLQYAAPYAKPQDVAVFMPPWMDDRARFYGLQTTWPTLNFSEDSWPDGYGYVPDEIQVSPGASLWIFIETQYKSGDKEPSCRTALTKVVPQALGRAVTSDELDRLMQENVLCVTRVGITGMNSHEVKAIVDGNQEPRTGRTIITSNDR